jgi:hypothetical protein
LPPSTGRRLARPAFDIDPSTRATADLIVAPSGQPEGGEPDVHGAGSPITVSSPEPRLPLRRAVRHAAICRCWARRAAILPAAGLSPLRLAAVLRVQIS